MKKNIIVLLLVLCALPAIAATTSFIKTIDNSVPGRTRILIDHIWREKLNYTSGGLTFTFPTNLFSSPPIILVTHKLNGAYSAGTSFAACIESSDATQAVVRIDLITSSTVAEAATNDVTVSLVAIGG